MADLSTHENATVRELWARIQEFAAPLEELLTDIRKSSPPTASELDKEVQTSDDPRIVALRDEIHRLQNAINDVKEQAREVILEGYTYLSEDELAAKRTAFNEASKRVTATLDVLRKLAVLMDIPGVLDELEKYEVPTLRGMGRLGGGPSHSTAPKPRIAKVAVTKDNASKEFNKFSLAAQWGGHSTTHLYDAWMRQADATRWQDVRDETTVEVDGVVYTITPATPGAPEDE